MVHHKMVERYPGTLTELANDLGNLRYDALSTFLQALAAKLDADGATDAGRGRHHLSAALREAGEAAVASAVAVERAWTICAPRMRDDA